LAAVRWDKPGSVKLPRHTTSVDLQVFGNQAMVDVGGKGREAYGGRAAEDERKRMSR